MELNETHCNAGSNTDTDESVTELTFDELEQVAGGVCLVIRKGGGDGALL